MMPTPLEMFVLGSSAMAGIGVAIDLEGTNVPLFSAVLIASRRLGVLVIKGMDLRIAAGGICG